MTLQRGGGGHFSHLKGDFQDHPQDHPQYDSKITPKETPSCISVFEFDTWLSALIYQFADARVYECRGFINLRWGFILLLVVCCLFT